MKRLWLPTLLLAFLSGSYAYADGCDSLDSNPVWNAGRVNMEKAYKNGDYAKAREYGESIYDICPISPSINYLMAKVHEKLGDNAKRLFYLQIATRNTKDFAVDADVLEKMWFERFITENPELSPDSVNRNKEIIEQQKLDYDGLNNAYNTLQNDYHHIQTINEDARDMLDSHNTKHKVLMWSGVGIAGAGLVLTITGATLVATMDSPLVYDNKSIKPENMDINPSETDVPKARIESKYAVSWGLVGAGIATSLLGAALAGYAGYYYTHPDTVSFAIAPNGMMISGSF